MPCTYLESSSEISGVAISGPARGYHSGLKYVNFRGNTFHFYGADICMGCYMDFYFYKTSTTGTGTGIMFPGNVATTSSIISGFEDQHGNTYMRWDTDYIGSFGGGLYNITGGYNSTLFKYTGNTLKWIIDFKAGGTVYSDMNDNLFVLYNNNQIKKYDSTGTLIDSALFTAQTVPAFMDSLGGFYRYKNDSLIKFDFANNTIWALYLPGSVVSYDMQGPEIFTCNATTINMVSLSGVITSYPNAAGVVCNQYDLNGNYYKGPSIKYNLNTGLVYNDTTVHFPYSFMDRAGRFYRFGYEDFSQAYSPVAFNLPPDIFKIETMTANSYGEWFTWRQVFSTDHINKNINFNLNLNNYFSFCTGTPATSTIEFSYDIYPQALSYMGVNVELSDSSGSFLNPVLLGVTYINKLNFSMPPGIVPGNNYRIRLLPNLQGYTASNNISQSFRIKQAPTAAIAFTNAVQLIPSYNGVGFCDTITLTGQTNSNAPVFNWQNF